MLECSRGRCCLFRGSRRVANGRHACGARPCPGGPARVRRGLQSRHTESPGGHVNSCQRPVVRPAGATVRGVPRPPRGTPGRPGVRDLLGGHPADDPADVRGLRRPAAVLAPGQRGHGPLPAVPAHASCDRSRPGHRRVHGRAQTDRPRPEVRPSAVGGATTRPAHEEPRRTAAGGCGLGRAGAAARRARAVARIQSGGRPGGGAGSPHAGRPLPPAADGAAGGAAGGPAARERARGLRPGATAPLVAGAWGAGGGPLGMLRVAGR